MIERPFDKLAEEIIQNDIKNLVILYKSNFFTNNKGMKHELIKFYSMFKNSLVKSDSTFTVLKELRFFGTIYFRSFNNLYLFDRQARILNKNSLNYKGFIL